tara:strand:+ start:225 stop:407 length:183 start_codon:yes stop_codon:yes gene_type:complete
MPEVKATITHGQKDFLERKKGEIRIQQRLAGKEKRVTNSTVIQALLDMWMRMEDRETSGE